MFRWCACLAILQAVLALDSTGAGAALRGGILEEVETAVEFIHDVPDSMTTKVPWNEKLESPQSIVTRIMQVIDKQLHNEKYQWVNPLLAFVFGGIMVVNGEACFKYLLAAAMFICVFVLTAADLGKVWPQGDDPIIRNIVSVEAGLIAGYATCRGIHGVVVVLGAMIGGCIAFSVQSTLKTSGGDHGIETSSWLLFLYTLSVTVSVWFFQQKMCKLLAVVSALAGSALVVSAGLWVVTELVAHKKLNLVGVTSPRTGAWVDFLKYLVNSSVEDKGLFANADTDFNILGAHFSLDRMLGFGLWLVVFIGGLQIQLQFMGCTGGAKKAKVVEARGLTARLLQRSCN